MNKLIYKIEFYSYWHTGSGLSTGTNTDMAVIKDENGLPYIQGKTLKGLLREAAESIQEFNSEMINQNFIDRVFGEKSKKTNDNDKKESKITKESECYFADATLSENTYNYLKDKVDLKDQLYTTFASTQIDENGVAAEYSLREMEVTIPINLFACIKNVPEEYYEQINYCLSYVKRIGINRNRGLGRCKLSIFKN